MALHKIGDRHPNYRDTYFKGRDLKGLDVYSAENHKVGSVDELLVDEQDQLQYLVVKSGGHKRVLVPVDRCTDLPNENRIYTRTLNREEFGHLSKYDDSQYVVGRGLEIYQMTPLEQSVPVEMTVPVEERGLATEPMAAREFEPAVAREDVVQDVAEKKDRPIQLYEERITTQRQRVKTGEVKISKRTVTETNGTAIPITKEKVIIEIESIYGGETRVDFGDAEVAEDGTVRMGIYEDQAEVCRRVVPYQNVTVRKETMQDVVRTQETIRREELDVSSQGAPVADLVDWHE